MNEFSAGTHLITTATTFGAGALAFAIMPFLIVILKGIFRAKDNTASGFNILGVILSAFAVHAFFCLMFISVIKVLDITYLDEANYFSNKIYSIFWAGTESEVFSLVGGGKTADALGAYATLKLVQTLGKLILVNIPIVVFILGLFYGAYQGTKDTYKQDYLSIFVFTAVSAICASLIYIAWAYIASQALFLPNSKDLFDMVAEFWKKQLIN